jgi:hypothetical protein
MSKQLAISTIASVLAMAAFALYAQPAASTPAHYALALPALALPTPAKLSLSPAAILPR